MSRIITVGEETRVWDAKTGAELFSFKGHRGIIFSAAYSPDGSRIVTNGNDNTVRIWDAASGVEVMTLKANVSSFAFSPDGVWLALGDNTGTVRLLGAKPRNNP
jgi:WD40 repeat protein